MAKINYLHNSHTYKLCDDHQPVPGETEMADLLDDINDCDDCYDMGPNPSDSALLADTEQDPNAS